MFDSNIHLFELINVSNRETPQFNQYGSIPIFVKFYITCLPRIIFPLINCHYDCFVYMTVNMMYESKIYPLKTEKLYVAVSRSL